MEVWGSAKDFDLKLFHKQVGNERADGGTHGSTMYLFLILTLEEEVCVFKAKLQYCDDVCNGHVGPVGSVGQCGVLL